MNFKPPRREAGEGLLTAAPKGLNPGEGMYVIHLPQIGGPPVWCPHNIETPLPDLVGANTCHVSNIHPGSYRNQTTAQVCSTNKASSFLNLESHCDRKTKVQVVFPEMDDTSGIATSLPSEASTSTASANPIPSESLSYQPTQGHIEIFPSNPGHMEEMAPGERTIPLQELKTMLRQQLEYYFSRENLSTDAYLMSQMDSDNYVPISTIAKFNQIRRLTEDINLVVEVLR
ncbi:la-related protein 4-like, partial [Stegodyphus dumicola]|uniref:la-related protein 4-like n=1 Tax=Stegodyphus dumicola TaxID=202533 RepID=UPI0015AF9E11